MTVSSATNEATYPGNGVTQIFPLPFRFFNNGDIIAQLVDESTGAASTLSQNTDYTLSGAGDPEVDGNATGVLTMLTPVAVGFSLFVRREIPLTQPTDIINQGRFFPEIHETVFDRLLMQIQQGIGSLGKALRVVPSEPNPAFLPLINDRANRLLSFDSEGNPIAVAPASGDASELAIDLANSTDPAKGAALVGYGGRTVAQNLDDVLNVLNFGASTSNTAEQNRVAFQAALDEQASTGKAIYVPGSAGEYLTGALRASAPVVMFGAGQGKTVIRFNDTTQGVAWLDFNLPTPVNGSYTLIEGFTLYGPGRLVDNNSVAFKFAPGVGTNRSIKFSDVWIEDFNLYGIQVPDSIHFKAIDCRFRRIGVRAAAGDGGKGAGIRWQAGGGFVNPQTSCIQNEVVRCTFSGQFVGIQCLSTEPAFFCTIQDSDFQDCRYGITANFSRVWRIIGCYFEFNDVAGAELQDGIEIGSRQTYGAENDIVFSGRYVRLDDKGLRIGRAGVDTLGADIDSQRVTARLLSGTLVYGTDQSGTGAAPGIYSGLGSPVGVVAAAIGSIYFDRGAAPGAGALWVKFGGSSTTNNQWAPAALVRSGATASRPSSPQVGTSYFDTSLGKPIWWSGAAWVDATGATV